MSMETLRELEEEDLKEESEKRMYQQFKIRIQISADILISIIFLIRCRDEVVPENKL